jgi:iron complex outermembrane receptor protein
MSFRRSAPVLSLAIVALLAQGTSALAQAQEARLAGTVRDATGAAVPGATVTAVNQATNATKAVATGTDGSYSLSLPPGTYTVTVSRTSFARQTRKELKVEAGGTQTADFALEASVSEEITVTALKRESTLQEVPFSVAAPTERELQKRGVTDLEGVAANVAGFSVQNLGPGQSQVAMRGVSSGQIARDMPGVKESVGGYLDESVISMSLFTPEIDLFDVSRVEVLRGPQGTLFGSGSLSGTVRYITNQPEPGRTQWFGELGASTIDGGNQGGDVKLGVNAPLGDTAAVRVAGYYNRVGGYIDSPASVRSGGVVRPDPSRLEENINTGDRYGIRAAVRLNPSAKLILTPRFYYQKTEMDGWNRIDAFNILANPYTTTRPAVTLGDRQLYAQIGEPYSDEFILGDLSLSYLIGSVTLTSVTSFNHRDVLVVRDAGALTASITGGSLGLGENVYSLDAPLDDATTAKSWAQEIRFSGLRGRLQWVAGGFYGSTRRDYGQSLLVAGFEDLTGIETAGDFGAGRDVLFFSDLHYELDQFALFGEATYIVNDALSLTAGLRYYDFNEDRSQVFDGIFADPSANPASVDASGVAPRFIASYKLNDGTTLNAQISKGFRLGGINDPLNVPLCTPSDLETFSGRDSWADETAWNYELGSKSRLPGGRGTLNVSAFYMDVSDLQATVTAGSCSSRLVFNVPEARSAGAEIELAMQPNNNFDFAVSMGFNDSQLRSTIESTAADGTVSVVSGIREGNRLPSVPQFQAAAAATYQWQMSGGLAYVTGTYQHIGSRYTQVGDEEPGFGTISLLSFAPNTIGGPLTQGSFTFDPLLPAYDLFNLRLGLLRGQWDFSLYANNLFDEQALLSLDRERGLRARVGYLTNQPRTFGLTARFKF